MFTRVAALVGLLGLVVLYAAPVAAQQQSPLPPAPISSSTRICGQDVAPPVNLPPAGSGPVLYLYAPCFEEQGGASVIEPETYLYYMHLKPSLPTQNQWTPWDEEAEKTVHDDFVR